MRIGLDVQTLETNEARRGIGMVCLWTIDALLMTGEHELVLVGTGTEPPAVLSPEVLAATRYVQMVLPGDPREHLRLGCAAEFLWSTPGLDGLDVYHVTSPLMPDILLPVAGRIPIVATVLDAIPAIPEENNWTLPPRWYDQRLQILRTYQGYLPISESAADDAVSALDLARNRMTVTYLPIRDLKALPIDKDAPARYGLRPGYVVSVTGYHPRKNIAGTLAAFARLHRSEGGDRQIAIICSLQPDERAEVEGIAKKLGIADQVVLTGYVTEGPYSLVAGASASLFLSRYEGFGIPAAETLAAGVPLVCSNVSSLPEVCGDAAVMVDPYDEERAAEGLQRVLASQEWREALIERGLRHVKKFRPEEFLRRIVDGYQNTLESLVIQEPPTSRRSEGARLRVACFTPLPPRMSGIADYSVSLLKQLALHADLDCFVEATVGEDHSPLGECGIFEFSSFERSHRQRPYDVILYQLGNNTHHAYALPFVKHHPGVAVIHDFSLLGLKRQMARSLGRRYELMLQFAEEYPEADAKVWEDDAQLDRLNFEEFPMTGGEMRLSRSVIVHSEWLRRRAEQMLPGVDVAVIPLGVDLNAADCVRETRGAIRRRFLLPEEAFVILSIGVINRLKRLDVVMDAFVDFHKRHRDSRFVLMGPADRILLRSLNQFTAAHRLKHAVHILGHRSTNEMYEMISASDVCVNLRYPSMGESSATLAMIMAMGRPALVTPVGQFQEFPDDICGKIPLGADEKTALIRQFEELHENPETGRRMGEKARAFVEDRGWPDVARRYWSCLEKAASEKSDQVPARIEQVDNEIESETL